MSRDTFTYIFRWDRHGRKGQPCLVLARGAMNSCLVKFDDGYTMVHLAQRSAEARWAFQPLGRNHPRPLIPHRRRPARRGPPLPTNVQRAERTSGQAACFTIFQNRSDRQAAVV